MASEVDEFNFWTFLTVAFKAGSFNGIEIEAARNLVAGKSLR